MSGQQQSITNRELERRLLTPFQFRRLEALDALLATVPRGAENDARTRIMGVLESCERLASTGYYG